MLMKIREKIKGKEQGFTLIELIVVLAILAVLALLAVPRFADILEQSRLKTHNQNIEQIAAALELYAADRPIPADLDVDDLVTAKYLKENPEPPYSSKGATVTDYTFTVDSDTTPYTITITPGWAATDNNTGNLVGPADDSASEVYPKVDR